jgi:DNA-damage-inducible protein J
MTRKAVVRARIDGHIKTEAEAVLAAIGLTVSDAFRMMMVRIATEITLSFEPLIPNSETIEAMKAARRGDRIEVEPVGHLLASLNAGD